MYFQFALTKTENDEEHDVDDKLPKRGPDIDLPILGLGHLSGGPHATDASRERSPTSLWLSSGRYYAVIVQISVLHARDVLLPPPVLHFRCSYFDLALCSTKIDKFTVLAG